MKSLQVLAQELIRARDSGTVDEHDAARYAFRSHLPVPQGKWLCDETDLLAKMIAAHGPAAIGAK